MRLLITAILMALLGCSGAKKNSEDQSSVRLALKPKLREVELSQYHSRSSGRSYKGEMLERKDQEQLDFRIRTVTVGVQPNLNSSESRIHYLVTSQDKVGEGSLNEFAFPEPGKKLNMSLNPYGDVLEAKGYSKDSVFYVPSISLPKQPVKIGDTWALEAEWKTAAEGIPLILDIVTIFKKQTACGKENCAVLEVSGDIRIKGLAEDTKLTSDVKGLILFAIDSGRVVWSHVQSSQNLKTKTHRTELNNCLISYTLMPEWKKLKELVIPYCRVGEELTIEQVPKI